MESVEAALRAAWREGYDAPTRLIDEALKHRLHHDYAMDRVIHAAFVELNTILKESRDTLCPPSTSTNPTTTPNS